MEYNVLKNKLESINTELRNKGENAQYNMVRVANDNFELTLIKDVENKGKLEKFSFLLLSDLTASEVKGFLLGLSHALLEWEK